MAIFYFRIIMKRTNRKIQKPASFQSLKERLYKKALSSLKLETFYVSENYKKSKYHHVYVIKRNISQKYIFEY